MNLYNRIAVLLVSCVAAAQAQTQTPLSVAQTEQIDQLVIAELTRQHIPGAEVGVYRGGHAVLLKGYGLANVELQVPVKAETVMQSGSVGKQFTATAVMMLVEQGKVNLDDSISRYFPGAPPSWEPIRVKNLLSHTSGLAEYESEERARPGGEFDLRLDFTEDEIVSKIERLPIEFQPGESWKYRNTNYVLLGALVRKVTGKFYGDFLQEKIFRPLGMTATRIISERDIVPNRSAGYELEKDELKNQKYVSPSFNSTADGALYFNVIDLEKWDRALYGESLISRASLERMWTPFVLNNGKPNESGYGFGWSIREFRGNRILSHGGAWQGFTTTIARFLGYQLSVVVLTNLDAGHAKPETIAKGIAGIVEPELTKK